MNDEVRTTLAVDLGKFAGGLIEHATLQGNGAINATGNTKNNRLTGNDDVNVLLGLAGNDTLDGGKGDDDLRGGAGNDTYVVDSLADVVNEESNNNSGDTVRSFIAIDLSTFAGGKIEHAALLGTEALDAVGSNSANILTGNAGANSLDGGAGNDTLDGGGGADTLKGGSGNDVYMIDSLADLVTEGTNLDASDEVRSASLSIDLGSFVGIENAGLLGDPRFEPDG